MQTEEKPVPGGAMSKLNRRAFFGLFAGVAATLGLGRKAEHTFSVEVPGSWYSYPVKLADLFDGFESKYGLRLVSRYLKYDDQGRPCHAVIAFLKGRCTKEEALAIDGRLKYDMACFAREHASYERFTLQEYWFPPDVFDLVKNQEHKRLLYENFPQGFHAGFINGKLVECRNAASTYA